MSPQIKSVCYCSIMLRIIRLFLFACSLAIAIPPNAYACLNSYSRAEPPFLINKLDLQALLAPPDKRQLPYWHHGFHDDQSLQHDKDSLDRIGFQRLDFKGKSDYAVILLKMGETDRAIKMLRDLYETHPREYNILANLATALELAGQSKEAHELLEKAIALNPASHYGSEWIHLRILEQKIATQPDYKQIIQLGVGNFSTWITDKKYVFPRPADSLKLQLAYQLHERIAFIAPPDAIIGQLVFDFADIVAKNDSLEAAIPFYNYAAGYSTALKDSVAARKEAIKEERKIVKNTFRWAGVVWAIPILVLVVVFVAWLRHRPPVHSR